MAGLYTLSQWTLPAWDGEGRESNGRGPNTARQARGHLGRDLPGDVAQSSPARPGRGTNQTRRRHPASWCRRVVLGEVEKRRHIVSDGPHRGWGPVTPTRANRGVRFCSSHDAWSSWWTTVWGFPRLVGRRVGACRSMTIHFSNSIQPIYSSVRGVSAESVEFGLPHPGDRLLCIL